MGLKEALFILIRLDVASKSDFGKSYFQFFKKIFDVALREKMTI